MGKEEKSFLADLLTGKCYRICCLRLGQRRKIDVYLMNMNNKIKLEFMVRLINKMKHLIPSLKNQVSLKYECIYESSAVLVENSGFDILLTRTFAKLTKVFSQLLD